MKIIRDASGKATIATDTTGPFESVWDWETLDQVVEIANDLTSSTNVLYIPIQRSNAYPKFDVIKAPAVGDDVSKGFNGDFYPCGKIVRISKTLKRITTSNGDVFYRRAETGAWIAGAFTLVSGIIDRQNPHF